MTCYRYLDFGIETGFVIPELQVTDLPVRYAVHRSTLPARYVTHWRHRWRQPGGDVVTMFGQRGTRLVLSFPAKCEFEMTPGQPDIHLFRPESVPVAEARRLLLDQVLPRLEGESGLVLHAALVRVSETAAIMVVGDSGTGKSTFAGAAVSAGFDCLSDDCVMVSFVEGKWRARGNYASLKLDRTSIDAMGLGGVPIDDNDFTNKIRLRLPASDQADFELAAVLLLRPRESGPFVREVRGATPAMALSAQTFVLDPSKTAQAQDRLRNIAELLGSGIPVFEVATGRNVRTLPAEIPAIIEQVTARPNC